MPRLADFTPIPHPTIEGEPFLGRFQGRSRVMVAIRCPRCAQVRERTASEARKEVTRASFKGLCRPCAIAAVKDGTHRWSSGAKGERRRFTSEGYELVYPDEVADEALPMYRAMQRSGQPVMAHRWTMAKHLGRALRSDELVDHKSGVKSRNDVENLRLYVRGKQQPGSCPGHGTYYHEWQMALRELELLKASL